MKKQLKKAFLMMALAALPLAMQAQTKYHDVEANDAKGAVKSITVSMMGQEQTTQFTEEGKMQMDALKEASYDDNGYLKTTTIEANGMTVTMSYTWENGKVKKQSSTVMGQQVETTYIYNDKGEITKQQVNMGGQEMALEFTDYKYDDHGNWISRKTTVMGQEMESPRTIEYYK